MYKSRNKIVGKFVEKLLKYRIMFEDILTFTGLERCSAYNNVICCPRNQYAKNQINRIITSYKILLLKKVKN